jgi:hypothetical protein
MPPNRLEHQIQHPIFTMLTFSSSSARIVNSRRAIADCLEAACEGKYSPSLLIMHASIGHDFNELASEAA